MSQIAPDAADSFVQESLLLPAPLPHKSSFHSSHLQEAVQILFLLKEVVILTDEPLMSIDFGQAVSLTQLQMFSLAKAVREHFLTAN